MIASAWIRGVLVVCSLWASAPWGVAAAAEESEAGFVELFDGKTLDGWVGDVAGYKVEDGAIVCHGGNLYTAKEYDDFELKLQFKLPPGGNNGVGLRTPQNVDAAYAGMEIQVLDDPAPQYKDLQPYQVCGSIYGCVPAKPGHVKPAGEWNEYHITAKGKHVTVVLNGETIVDADLQKVLDDGPVDHKDHPGLKNDKGHVSFCGHGAPVAFRHIRIKPL